MRTRHPVIALLLSTALLGACAEQPTESANAGPVSLVIVAGDAQVGVAGTELPIALKVRVLADNNRPRVGFLVNFRVTKGAGRMYAGSAITDKDGYAQDYWTLGNELFVTQQVDVVAVDPTSGAKLNYGSFTATGASTLGANLVITPSSADLGAANINTTGGTTTFTVTNTGAAASGTIATALGGTNAADFQLGANTCTGATLAMGATCQVAVQLAPVTAGSLSASLSASATPGGTATAALQGSSIGVPALAITPTSHGFGSVSVGSASSNQVFTVSNSGSAASGPLSATLAGANASQFQIVTSTCAGALAAGASCTVTAKYQPTSAGSHTASLDVTGAPGGTVSSALTGSAVAAAQLDITPASASFGAVVPMSTVITLNFTVTNIGGSPSGVPAPQIIGGSGPFAIASSTCTAALPVGGTCVVAVRFQPTGVGAFNASLGVSASPGGSDTSTLTGYGVSSPQLSFSPTSWNFGSVATGAVSAYQQIMVTAIGGAGPIAVSIVGANPSDFTIGSASTCLNASLSAGQSCSVLVRFEPAATGARSASLQVVSTTVPTGGSGVVPLAGTGFTGPSLTISPTSANFGTVTVGSSSSFQNLVVTNVGNASSGPLSVVLGGTNAAEFQLGGNTCTGVSLAAGASCTIAAQFSPTVSGSLSATLQVSASPGGSVSATLTGTGNSTTPANLVVTPSSGSFGSVPIGSPAGMIFTITNTGGAPTTMGLSVSGGEFTIVASTCAGGLNPGASCSVTVQFVPRTLGTVNGWLAVSSTLPTITVPLSGTGI